MAGLIRFKFGCTARAADAVAVVANVDVVEFSLGWHAATDAGMLWNVILHYIKGSLPSVYSN